MPPLASILPNSLGFYIGLMVAGFFVGGFGHLIRSKPVIAVGVALIFLATFLLPIALNISSSGPENPPNIPGPTGE